MTDPSTAAQPSAAPAGSLMQEVSTAMVSLHKEQFGRGPTKAQSHFAGPDALLCVMEDALLPAERAMVAMGEQQRVRDTRMFFQVATADRFIAAVEQITGRTVRAFASATDPDRQVVMENFIFEPEPHGDGRAAG
jgi:uncharacterized protein YbcI